MDYNKIKNILDNCEAKIGQLSVVAEMEAIMPDIQNKDEVAESIYDYYLHSDYSANEITRAYNVAFVQGSRLDDEDFEDKIEDILEEMYL